MDCFRLHETVLRCIWMPYNSSDCDALNQRTLNCIGLYWPAIHCIKLFYTQWTTFAALVFLTLHLTDCIRMHWTAQAWITPLHCIILLCTALITLLYTLTAIDCITLYWPELLHQSALQILDCMYWRALHCTGLHTCIILNQPELLMDYMNLNYVLLHGIVFTQLLAALNCTDPQRTPLDCFTLHCIASACIIDSLGLDDIGLQ